MFHRKAHGVSVREAFGWSTLWIVTTIIGAGVVFSLLAIRDASHADLRENRMIARE